MYIVILFYRTEISFGVVGDIKNDIEKLGNIRSYGINVPVSSLKVL